MAITTVSSPSSTSQTTPISSSVQAGIKMYSVFINKVNVWDIREGKSIATLCGPKVSGDSVDIRGDYILTGANRGIDQLQLWDWRTQKIATQFKWDEEKEVHLT